MSPWKPEQPTTVVSVLQMNESKWIGDYITGPTKAERQLVISVISDTQTGHHGIEHTRR